MRRGAHMSATQKRLASAERAMERAKEENATKKANVMRRAVMAVWSQEALNAHEPLKTIFGSQTKVTGNVSDAINMRKTLSKYVDETEGLFRMVLPEHLSQQQKRAIRKYLNDAKRSLLYGVARGLLEACIVVQQHDEPDGFLHVESIQHFFVDAVRNIMDGKYHVDPNFDAKAYRDSLDSFLRHFVPAPRQNHLFSTPTSLHATHDTTAATEARCME